MKKVKSFNHQNWATEKGNLTEEEFAQGIQKAETGNFFSIEDSKKIIAQWKAERKEK